MTGHADLHGLSFSDYENNFDAAALADAVIELGAQRTVGEVPSKSIPGRSLPLL